MTVLEKPLPYQSAEQARAPHVIAIASGKGGVGKSSISVNLGIALSRMGKKVCIFDADTGLANINILLGLVPEYSLEHVVHGSKSLCEVMLTGPYDLKVIPGANGITECVSLRSEQQLRLVQELSSVETNFDYLLVDTAAGIGDITLDFTAASQQTLIVITPEPTSLTDAFSLIRLLGRRGKQKDFHVVVNMCSSAHHAREIFHRFSAAVEKYIGISLQYLGFVLQDESLRSAVTMQSPVTLFQENDPSCRTFFRLARTLEDTLLNVTPVASFSAYWKNLCRLQKRKKGEETIVERGQESSLSIDELRSYLGELRSKLLSLITREELPKSDFVILLEELNQALGNRLDLSQKSSSDDKTVDVVDEIDRMILDRDQHVTVLMDIYGKLSPLFAEFSVLPKIDDLKNAGSFDVSPSENTEVKDFKSSSSHSQGYDELRFGAQENLLRLLRQSTDVSLHEWFKQFKSN